MKRILVAAFLLLGSVPVLAADPPVTAGAAYELTGFRSARFGMTEQEVRAAIGKDFGAKAGAVKASDNLYEQTKILSLAVPELLPKGGTAEVNYTFGFKSKRLIQVTLVWSKASDPAITADMITANGTLLAGYFMSAGYQPNTIAQNKAAGNGLVLFQGSDAQGHTTVALLEGTVTPGENGNASLTPTQLTVRYIQDPRTPDVYKLPPGQF